MRRTAFFVKSCVIALINMTTLICNRCRRDAGAQARFCTYCGSPDLVSVTGLPPRQPAKMSRIVKFGGGFLAAMFVLAVIAGLQTGGKNGVLSGRIENDSPVRSSDAMPIAPSEKKVDKCKGDIQCAAMVNPGGASVYCKPPIEKLAQYSVRWKEVSWYEPTFDHFRWLDKSAGTITYVRRQGRIPERIWRLPADDRRVRLRPRGGQSL